MDFKSRFAGKMTKISADGGIEEVVSSSNKPIQQVDKITSSGLSGANYGLGSTGQNNNVQNTTGNSYARKPVSFGGGLGG
jgi:hypothetical protein